MSSYCVRSVQDDSIIAVFNMQKPGKLKKWVKERVKDEFAEQNQQLSLLEQFRLFWKNPYWIFDCNVTNDYLRKLNLPFYIAKM